MVFIYISRCLFLMIMEEKNGVQSRFSAKNILSGEYRGSRTVSFDRMIMYFHMLCQYALYFLPLDFYDSKTEKSWWNIVYIGFYPYFWLSGARKIKLKEIYGNRTYYLKAQDHTRSKLAMQEHLYSSESMFLILKHDWTPSLLAGLI